MSFDKCRSALPCEISLCMDLSFALPHGPKGSEGDQECIFFALKKHTRHLLLITLCDTPAEFGATFRTHRKMETYAQKKGQTDIKVEIVT